MLVALNKEARVTLINKAGCRMLGYKEKDIIGKNWFSNFIPKDERESARTVFKNLFKKEIKPVTYHENNILTRGGKLRVIAWHNTAIRDDQGDISGTLSSGTDITEQKRMLNSLMASEERLKILFEYAPDAYYLNDLQGNLIDGNQQAEKLIGQKREMLIGKNLLQVFNLDKNDIAKADEVLVKNSRGLSTERDEFPITRPDGTRVVLEISTHPVKIGTESLVLGIARDITKPKKMQAELDQYRQYLEDVVNDRTEKLNTALIESETNRDRMDTILKSVQEGLVVSDINHLVVMMNSLAEDWLNMRFSQALNRKVEQVFSQKKILNLINHALSDPSGTSRADIETRDNKTGVNRILEALAKTILDQTQKQIGVLTTLRDVTREREIDRLKTEFLSTTAHELRTPLTTIQGFSEVLLTRNDLTEEEKNKFLGYINKQAVNLSHIISDLLDISRIESGVGFSLKRKMCTVNNIISRIMENYRISHPKYRFTSNLETTDAPVFADREKIDQVVQNILSNAVNYSPPGTTIRATTKTLKDEYQVTIEDRGMGMTEEQVKRIFEKFYRADASDTAPKGTGLGMSIVKLIIDAHQGKVWVESKPGKGTRVIFTLPAGFREEDQKKPDDSGEIITRGFNKRGEEKK
jgi:PAS domain S-box-containing protein